MLQQAVHNLLVNEQVVVALSQWPGPAESGYFLWVQVSNGKATEYETTAVYI